MAIEQKYIDLINAEIDGEISAADQALLDQAIAENAEAQALRDDLAGLCADLGSGELLSPPGGLRGPALRRMPAARLPVREQIRGITQVLGNLFSIPAIRYGLSFAAGIVITFTLLDSNHLSRQAFDDVTSLVGTMSDIDSAGAVTSNDDMLLTLNELAGTVNLSTAGPLMILDFDLTSSLPIEIVATFDDRDIWFNGFAQLESAGTTVSTATGQVTVRMQGERRQRRYAVYLHKSGQNAATVHLRFVAAGETLHEGNLHFGKK